MTSIDRRFLHNFSGRTVKKPAIFRSDHFWEVPLHTDVQMRQCGEIGKRSSFDFPKPLPLSKSGMKNGRIVREINRALSSAVPDPADI